MSVELPVGKTCKYSPYHLMLTFLFIEQKTMLFAGVALLLICIGRQMWTLRQFMY